MVGGGRPLLPEILGQPAPVGAKSTIGYIVTMSFFVIPFNLHNALRYDQTFITQMTHSSVTFSNVHVFHINF